VGLISSMQRVKEVARCLLDLLYPPHCLACGGDVDVGEATLCSGCRDSLTLIDGNACRKCGSPVGEHGGTEGCPNCRGGRLNFSSAAAACRYEGLARDLILQFKYGRRIGLSRTLATLMVDVACRRGMAEGTDLVMPVPLHQKKRRERGFNQAGILAERVAESFGCPHVENLLVRVAETRAQTELGRDSRVANVKGAFAVREKTRVAGARVLLIDDVMTTGSTLSECAAVLRRAGAAEVNVLVAARD